ncbi:MAG: D-alanyl-D-alanine carboxypeptidase [Candidatus Fermentithermobacillus carboniphilus]|uniref:serine-type D-Ala-D-Ala carboxypeptidase n=1 Tax=Candidatus Fermentithermobacillus carboniphilus TaxID=3085328 RepID=A0AAT9LDJ7_9FIRM|nr:MAG: D-alanyl-D-alanine carboxypeptidase [Candidatus Fermentithermobacillus carboniphilus]
MSGRKRFKSIFAGILAVIFLTFDTISRFGGLPSAHAAPPPPEIAADSYILADLKTQKILFSKDPDVPHIPASLTKIMTLFITFDDLAAGKISLDDEVPVSEEAWKTGGSKMFLLVGTKVKLSDLVKGITVASGNDACVALAEYISGNVTSFVDRMNQKARSLGLSTARFVDPHGLSDENQISAKDLLTLVSAYVTSHPEALQFHSLKEFTYTPPGEKPITQFNRNRLLWTYPGVYGLKTGYTSRAGFNMVALCDRSGFSTIAIILGSAKGKSIDEGERERSELVTSMLDYAYRNFTYVQVAEPNSVVGKARVWKGKGKWTEAVAPLGLGATVEKGKEDKLTYTIHMRKDLDAPVARGTKVGEAIFICEGQEVGRMDLLAKNEVPKGNIFRQVWDVIARAFLRAFGRI